VKSYLRSYLKSERLKHKLDTAQLAEKIGYRNITKGMRRILDLEREGIAPPSLLKKVVDVLELDAGYIDSLIRKDREAYEAEYERWVNEPIKMYYTIRMMPTIYLRYDLPTNIKTEDEAIYYVSDIAKKKKCLAWLNLSRREIVFIDKLGEVTLKHQKTIDNHHLPCMKVG
jgi:transcriptional regulator with XRE-family HTH domain